MLKKRIIPVLLHNNLSLIKGSHFNSWRRIGITRPAIRIFNARDVDEIVLLDITATGDQRGPDLELISDVAQDCFVPLTIGGGIRTIQQIRDVLRSGADKVALNSICYESSELIAEAASVFGTQAIVASIDVQRTEGAYVCVSHSGTRKEEISLQEHISRVKKAGAGEFLITVVNDEGAMKGVDLDFYKSIRSYLDAPLIVSGGIGSVQDVCQIFEQVDPSAVGIGSLFAFTETTPDDVKVALKNIGMPVRQSRLN